MKKMLQVTPCQTLYIPILNLYRKYSTQHSRKISIHKNFIHSAGKQILQKNKKEQNLCRKFLQTNYSKMQLKSLNFLWRTVKIITTF